MVPGIVSVLIQIIVGSLAGMFYVKVLKKPVFGHLWGAVIIGIIGSVLGGFFLKNITPILINNYLTVDFIATLFGGFLLIWLSSKLTHQ